MADYLRIALDKYGAASHHVVLFLNSDGGEVDAGDRVIHLLDKLKPTHRRQRAISRH
jgi:ATP-dependent protease ClpP protease subunit